MSLLTFCKSLPKIELHAHLNGSLSDQTILRLIQAKRAGGAQNLPDSAEVVIGRGHNRTLEECFAVFGILHCLTDSVSAIKAITKDVIRDFVADNIRYLELRTTPKSIPDKMSKNQYIDAVLEVMTDEMKQSNITIRLLLSIDRGRGIDDAWDTLQLAKKYKSSPYTSLICGLDVSGNPKAGSLSDYVPILKAAKEWDLRLAVHLAEIPNEEETLSILQSGLVDRIGHGSYIHPETGGTPEMHQLVKNGNIPIEICISSNIKSGTVKNISDHHFKHWNKENHPVIICTDDKGVFNTSLSEEYLLCGETFNLEKSNLRALCLNAVQYTFLPREERDQLLKTMEQELDLKDLK